jgi:Fimbrial assembly protein (PilN)
MTLGSPQGYRQGPPLINLLPREIGERRLVRRQRTAIGASFAVLLALLGCWYLLERSQLADTRREADAEQAVAAGLRAHRTQLQPYADLSAEIAASEQLRTRVYATEIRFSSVLRDLSAIMPDNVWLTKMTAAPTSTSGGATGATPAAGTTGSAPSSGAATATSGTTPGSPGADSPIATITFTGAGLGHVDVGQLLRALANGPKNGGRPVYLNPYFTSSQKAAETGGEATVTFSASVDLSKAAYSGRFQPTGQQGTVTP